MLKKLCPISNNHINENIARINAFIFLIVMGIYFYTDYYWIIIILLLDFFLKGFLKMRYSLSFHISLLISKVLRATVKYTNEGPKIFSSRIGFMFCIIILLFHFLSMPLTTLILASVLTSFMFLEAFFGFCTACHFYPYLLKYIYDY